MFYNKIVNIILTSNYKSKNCTEDALLAIRIYEIYKTHTIYTSSQSNVKNVSLKDKLKQKDLKRYVEKATFKGTLKVVSQQQPICNVITLPGETVGAEKHAFSSCFFEAEVIYKLSKQVEIR